jgi:hypothetical protein
MDSAIAIKAGIQNRNCDELRRLATSTALSAHNPTAGFIAPAATRVFAKDPILLASKKGKPDPSLTTLNAVINFDHAKERLRRRAFL